MRLRPLRAAIVGAALALAIGCGTGDDTSAESTSAESTSAESARAESTSAESTGTPTAESTPRGPRGAEAVRCDGASVDPDFAAYERQVQDGQLEAAVAGLEAAVGAHPGSATARVRLGELLLRTQPPRASQAANWFERGLALDEEGCGLADRDLWAALEGAGIARLMQGDYAAARPFFERSLARWPSIRATRYNLACTQCQAGETDACAASIAQVLAAEEEPGFLGEQRRAPDHYRDMARRDPDLAPLRADGPAFERLLAGER